jgi:Tfp pilus assembly protein PilN
MMRAIGLLALLAVLGAGAASAQVMDAPIGHRQPTAADVPNEKLQDPNDFLTKENEALDRKVKSICRGCEDEQAVRGKHQKGRRHPDTAAQH